MHRLLFAFASTAVVLSVAQASEPIQVSVPAFSCLGGAHGARLPTKLSELRAVGPLREERVVRVEEWEGYKAVEKKLRFDGLSVHITTFTNDPERYSLAALSIESSRWALSPFRVGQSMGPQFERLGAKPAAGSGAWRFLGESDSLYVEVREGKVVRVVYECYTG